MPETRGEWVIFALGLCATFALALLVGLARSDDTARGSPSAASSTLTAPTESDRAPATTAPDEPGAGSGTAVDAVRLQLTAARGDSWIEVREESSAGAVLYVGTMAEGETRTFSASQLHARFGKAGSLDARLNGDVLRLQDGTYSALITAAGLEEISTE